MSDPLDLDSILPNLIPLWEEAEKVLNHTAQGAWTSKTTKMPMRAQTVSSKGGEVLLTEHPTRAKTANLKSPPVHAPSWLQNDIGKGPGISSTKSALVGPPTLVESHDISPGVPPVATPMMSILSETTSPKGKETTSSRFTTWRKTVALIDSEPTSFQVSSWMQAGASKDWESPPTKAEKPVPVTSYGIPPETQPVPTTGVPLPLASPSTERGQDLLKTTEASVTVTQPPSPKTTRASLPIQTGNLGQLVLSTSPQKTGVLPKVYSRCPKAPKRESSITLPAASAVTPKMNPCVMELCKFFQQCLCMRQRRYSREEIMRYCIENYSWFLKNAAYVCEKVKRMSYSSTLKQKCLTSICKSI
ncbi:HERV-H LTR-associating protein 1 [Sphaerodactylus townsendi]|nr:HERV-H LTR-associating protein 1 [Sphaerodactylus townsendi]